MIDFFTLPSGIVSEPAIANDGTLYLADRKTATHVNHLYAVNPNGTRKWRYELNEHVSSGPILGHDGTVYSGTESGQVYAIDPAGALRWQYKITYTGATKISSLAIGPENTLYMAVRVTNFVYADQLRALNADGQMLWHRPIRDGVQSPLVLTAEGILYISAGSNSLEAFYANGEQMWSIELDGFIDQAAAIGADGTIYVGSTNGHAQCDPS